MARLSVKYDDELKGQVFVLRGDEDYARTTKTVLELGNYSMGGYGFDLSVTVNVLRDKSAGTIAIYDNDVLLNVIDDWTAQDNARTIVLNGLDYDITHNIIARYMGNTKCSPSSSTVQTISVEDTNRSLSTLSLQTGTTQFTPNTEYSDTIILSNPHSESYNVNQPIEIRYDGELVDTVTTDDEGQIAFTINDVGANGLHNISFHFDGSTNLTTSELNVDLSVGYNVQITNYQSVAVNGNQYRVEGTVTDWFGEPHIISHDTVLLDLFNDGTKVDTRAMAYGSDGIFGNTFTIDKEFNRLQASYYNYPDTQHAYNSSVISVSYINPEGLVFSSDIPRLHQNEITTLTGIAMPPRENVPIVLTGDVNETIYTNENGEATKTIKGIGKGSKTVNAQLGSLTESITLIDYIQYWGIREESTAMDYKIRGTNKTIYSFNNYYRIIGDGSLSSSSWGETILYFPNTSVPFELIVSGLTTSIPCVITCIDTDLPTRQDNFTNPSAHSNETWKFVSSNGVLNIYRNDTLFKSMSSEDNDFPYVVFGNNTQNEFNINFTKLTLRGL